ncbi:hypothetical protein [Fischerella sp. PCC 9605]|nr:hypothetical protein [Fischerella sp. PCC 9605]
MDRLLCAVEIDSLRLTEEILKAIAWSFDKLSIAVDRVLFAG